MKQTRPNCQSVKLFEFIISRDATMPSILPAYLALPAQLGAVHFPHWNALYAMAQEVWHRWYRASPARLKCAKGSQKLPAECGTLWGQ